MPVTRSKTNQKVEAGEHTGDKREHKAAAHGSDQPEAKSAKHEPNQKAGRRGSKAETKKAKDGQTQSKEKVKKVDPLEKGHVYFFYRPKVDTGDDVKSADDVQKLYMVLKPHWTRTGDRKPTLIILGRKKMPAVDNRARYWGFVGAADTDISKLTEAFKESSYETKTQGTRKIHASRPVAEGVYMITTHNGHSHLAYITTAPKEPGTVQEAFNIDKESSLIISIKASIYLVLPYNKIIHLMQAAVLNPETSNPAGAGLRGNRKAEFPKELQESFHDRRFIAMETTQFLNYANCEILLIGATDNLIQELGEVGEELHDLEEEDEFKVQGSGVENYIFDELKLEKNKVPIQPLHGEWK